MRCGETGRGDGSGASVCQEPCSSKLNSLSRGKRSSDCSFTPAALNTQTHHNLLTLLASPLPKHTHTHTSTHAHTPCVEQLLCQCMRVEYQSVRLFFSHHYSNSKCMVMVSTSAPIFVCKMVPNSAAATRSPLTHRADSSYSPLMDE